MAATAENIRTATRATIKRASIGARSELNRIDRQARRDIEAIYRQARIEIDATIRGFSDNTNTLRLQVLANLRNQLEQRLALLARQRDDLMDVYLPRAAELGISPWSLGIDSGELVQIPDDAVRFVRSFIAEDGLQLSDRIWRVNQQTRQFLIQPIEQAIIQGHSAEQAAREFLDRGIEVPRDVAAKMGIASTERVVSLTGAALLNGEGNPVDNALRLFRTEINRAHGEAYKAAAFTHPDVVGTRFLLSPRHPKADICDMHASVNRYGLGPGVYPKGRSPWPAHPNTLSFEEAVFSDEISDNDRRGKETRIEWLKKQPSFVQESVLGSRKKRGALLAGILKESEINTPWHILKKRYQRRGIDIDGLNPQPVLSLPAPPKGGQITAQEADDFVLERGLKTGHEYALAYDTATNELLFRKTSNQRSSVSFSSAEMSLIEQFPGTVSLVHNHPSSSSLSYADLQLSFRAGIRDVVAVGHNGTRYSGKSQVPPARLRSTYEAADRELIGLFPRVNADFPDIPDLEMFQVMHHMHITALDKLGVIRYEMTNASGSFAQNLQTIGTDYFNTIIDDIVEVLQ